MSVTRGKSTATVVLSKPANHSMYMLIASAFADLSAYTQKPHQAR